MTSRIAFSIPEDTATILETKAKASDMDVRAYISQAISLVECLPEPIVKLIVELRTSNESDDRATLTEFLRKISFEANSIAYGRSKARISALLPEGALDEYAEEPEENFLEEIKPTSSKRA